MSIVSTGEKLRSFRLSKGLTKKAMAEKLGVSLSLYEKVEGGQAGASANLMHRIKEVFPEVSIEKLFFEANLP